MHRVYIPYRYPMYTVLFDAEHALELLSKLNSFVVLALVYPAGVKHLLDLLLRVSLKGLFKLLKHLHQAVSAVLVLILVVQLVHCSSFLFAVLSRLSGSVRRLSPPSWVFVYYRLKGRSVPF